LKKLDEFRLALYLHYINSNWVYEKLVTRDSRDFLSNYCQEVKTGLDCFALLEIARKKYLMHRPVWNDGDEVGVLMKMIAHPCQK
jgi:hypothetical protein